jgi:hypothetical protein
MLMVLVKDIRTNKDFSMKTFGANRLVLNYGSFNLFLNKGKLSTLETFAWLKFIQRVFNETGLC